MLVNTGTTGMRAAGEVVVVIGHLPGRAETRQAEAAETPATMIHRTARPNCVITQRHMKLHQSYAAPSLKSTLIADSALQDWPCA